MHELLLNLGLIELKPLLGKLLLPPLPLLLLALAGGWQIRRRPLLGWLILLASLSSLYLLSTTALSRAITLSMLQPPPALNASAVSQLKRKPLTALVVLGGGRRASAPEYGTTTLNPATVERLRYGIWLSRETTLPLAFSGGIGSDGPPALAEAELAASIAEREFRHPLRWIEPLSRDTHENAVRSVALLRAQGIRHIVVITHAYHMPRALRNFNRAVADSGITVSAAPVARHTLGPWKLNDWLPSTRGMEENYVALHELLGLLAGA